MIKNLVLVGLIAVSSSCALAGKTEETKRDVAQAAASPQDAIKKIKFYEGTSTSYKLLSPANTQLVVIKGDSARNIWRSLSTKQYPLGGDEESQTFQKAAPNVTCERTFQKQENRHDYTCTILMVDGVVGSAGVG